MRVHVLSRSCGLQSCFFVLSLPSGQEMVQASGVNMGWRRECAIRFVRHAGDVDCTVAIMWRRILCRSP